GVDLIVFRELAGGLYYGTPRSRTEESAVNTMTYTRPEIERTARMAFKAAQERRKKVTSVDKANVLECSGLWRAVVTDVSREFPDVKLDHALGGSSAMKLV